MCYHSNPLSGPDTEEARQILENLFALLEVASVFLFLAAAVTLMYGIAIRPKSVDENGAGSDDSDDQPADRLPSKDAREAYHFSEDESIGTPLSSRDEIEHELRKCR